MKALQKSIIWFSLVLLAGCMSSDTPEMKLETTCEDPRSQICTMIYDPVCGHSAAGTQETYSSGCTACSKNEVVGYNKGACEA